MQVPLAATRGSYLVARFLWAVHEPEVERYEHQDDANVGRQPFPEVVSEEEDVHTDHDACHRDHVQRAGGQPSHRFSVSPRSRPQGPRAAVAVHPDGDVVTVAVEDTGEGVTAEATERMFDRVWRSEPSRAGNGSGLGLAIARGLVAAQGGRIWAEARAGGGARVSFTLPAPAG